MILRAAQETEIGQNVVGSYMEGFTRSSRPADVPSPQAEG